MPRSLSIVGAPSSAGAYAPGQEEAPTALRAAGLLEELQRRGVPVEDLGDVEGFRWRVDPTNRRAMNAPAAATVGRAVAQRVSQALATGSAVLVLGGDCTVELGTVAGAIADGASIGLVYIDLDTDLMTPASTHDGALDWMGVAHLLAIDNTDRRLTGLGCRVPLLEPSQVLFFANDNSTAFEREIIEQCGMAEVPLSEVVVDPSGAARSVVEAWTPKFERLLVHLDVDVLDFLDMPLAENVRRNRGLEFDGLMESLRVFLEAPNLAALTVTEVNPNHGLADGSTLRNFVAALADAFSGRAQ